MDTWSTMLLGLLTGLIVGIMPLGMGWRYQQKGLAWGGFIACAIAGLIYSLRLAVPVAVVWTIFIVKYGQPAAPPIQKDHPIKTCPHCHKEVHVMDCWEPMVFVAKTKGAKAVYADPKEGYLLWAMAAYLVNNPKRPAERTQAAFDLLDFMLGPWYGAKITGMRRFKHGHCLGG